jgi:pimeloyl-ACP methyl ester carboxylesterase
MTPLFLREYGAGEPLCVLHGLLGSGANWVSLARELAADRRVLVPDQRHHGRSPHLPGLTYADLAADLAALLDHLALPAADLLGHSMGGKVAMTLALTQPHRVRRLIVVDIAPVDYPPKYGDVLDALAGLDLPRLATREAADAALAATFTDPAFRQFLLMNLRRTGPHLAWGIDLAAIRAALPALLAFPLPAGAQPYPGPALWVTGERSAYVLPEHLPTIRRWFPGATQVELSTGHWVQAEQPQQFLAAVTRWLRATAPG